MATFRSFGVFLLGLTAVPGALGQACINVTSQYPATMAPGYKSKLILTGLTGARGLVFDTAGAIIAVSQGMGLVHLTLSNGTDDVCVTSKKTLATDTTLNHGIALALDGKTLYASSIQNLYSWDYNAATGTATNKKLLITNMTVQAPYHNTRTLLIPPTNPELLLVQRGSILNIDNGTTDPAEGRSVVKIFNRMDLDKIAPTNYTATGIVFGMGLRNSVGWGQDPSTGNIWSVENGMDDMVRDGKDVHQQNPAEELNFHGRVNDTKSKEFGANYGYPHCFPAWEPSLIANPNVKVGTQFMNEYSANVSTLAGVTGGSSLSGDEWCARERYAPKSVFSSHMAPLDIKFRKDGSAAYITMHGSWDKDPPEGYRLSRVDFVNGMPKEPSTSKRAEVIIMSNTNATACPSRCFRPVHMAWDPHVDGRLFFTSDQSGELYVVTGA